MTANVTFGNNFKGAENYQANKIVNGVNHSELIHFENVAPEYQLTDENKLVEKPLSIAQDMNDHAKSENTKVQKPVMNVSFNFHQEEFLSNKDMNSAIIGALKEVGIKEDNHKFSIRRHYDKPHPHAHVLISRVGLNGKVHDNSFIANRLMVACDKIEKEQYLRPTKGRIFVYDETKEKGYRKQTKAERNRIKEPKPTKKQKVQAVQNRVKAEFNAEKENSKSLDEIKTKLERKGIEMNIATNKNGVYGLSFKSDDIAVKASKIGIKAKGVSRELEQKRAEQQQEQKRAERQQEQKRAERQQEQKRAERQHIQTPEERYKTNVKNMENMFDKFKHDTKQDRNNLTAQYGFKSGAFAKSLDQIDKAKGRIEEEVKNIAQGKERTLNELRTKLDQAPKQSNLTFWKNARIKEERLKMEEQIKRAEKELIPLKAQKAMQEERIDKEVKNIGSNSSLSLFNNYQMEKEKQKQQPQNHSLSEEIGKAKVEMNEAQKRFLQKEKEMKQKQEQQQEQRKGMRR